jgi:hypothetical protein
MAQEFTDAAKNRMLDALDDTETLYISAHDASPGLTGANEISGGSYTREAGTWNAASGGSMTLNGTVTLDIPSGNTITYLGLWDIASAGTAANFMGQVAISSEAFGSDGTLDVTAFTLALDQDPA